MPSATDTEILSGRITSSKLRKLVDKQDMRCAVTGLCLTPQTVALDHIVPLSLDGPDTMENARLVHTIVNTMKGTLMHDEFVKWCRLVVAYCDAT
jgi:5-methylcytosine-specific restriction endonuclease McrA